MKTLPTTPELLGEIKRKFGDALAEEAALFPSICFARMDANFLDRRTDRYFRPYILGCKVDRVGSLAEMPAYVLTREDEGDGGDDTLVIWKPSPSAWAESKRQDAARAAEAVADE